MAEITEFISRFRSLSPSGEIIDVFTCGCCYWFAFILCERFQGTMMYDPVANHFAAGIQGRNYDITGDITDLYRMVPWEDYDFDPSARKRIEEYCIRFTKQ